MSTPQTPVKTESAVCDTCGQPYEPDSTSQSTCGTCIKEQEVLAIEEKIRQCEEAITQTETLLTMMREERNEVTERILKRQTLRHGRRADG
eukprot:m51a1_g4546 hypothetical protein (91) ;mRNA; f:62618-63072